MLELLEHRQMEEGVMGVRADFAFRRLTSLDRGSRELLNLWAT
jgi:hypothetical protein